jgi:hypothetical protein
MKNKIYKKFTKNFKKLRSINHKLYETMPIQIINVENIKVQVKYGVVRIEKNDTSIMTYSEEEVKQIIDATLIAHSDFVLADVPEWFEQFKKK